MTDPSIELLMEIAAEAAVVVKEVYAAPFDVDYKAPRDPVTEADRRANALICRRLADACPGIPIVAEESDPQTFAGFRSAERVFFVDPLDGTREFVDRNGEFVVMIGLLDGERASMGVIHAPATDTVYAGVVGQGAFSVGPDGARTALGVSDTSALGDARIVASRSHRSEKMEQALQMLGVGAVIALGSAGLKGAAVARGIAEAYVTPGYAGKRWDACAADALVRAAGGRFTDAHGRPIAYRGEKLANDQGVLASNGLLYDALLDRLARIREQQG